MLSKKKIVVLTGSGISVESGLSTFRDVGGLWEGNDINEVASIEGWYKNPEKVLDFYNLRREQAAKAKPNEAHYALSFLEEQYDVVIITQNVDDLHERAGSSNVVHLHGELNKARSVKNEQIIIDLGTHSIYLGDTASDGAQLRPHIVWFGEMVPQIEVAAKEVEEANILIVIGTSLVVYPAAGLVNFAEKATRKYIIDPSIPELSSFTGWAHIKKTACSGVPELVEKLLSTNK